MHPGSCLSAAPSGRISRGKDQLEAKHSGTLTDAKCRQIRMTASPDDYVAFRHQADEIEARILAAAHPPDRVN